MYVLQYLGGQIIEKDDIKGIVQQILRGVNTKLKNSVLVNWKPGHFSILNFKGTPSQEEHKTINNCQGPKD